MVHIGDIHEADIVSGVATAFAVVAHDEELVFRNLERLAVGEKISSVG